jgi:hypothetical protein
MLIDLHVLIHDGDTDALLETIPATLVDAFCLVDMGKLPDPTFVEAARSHGKKIFVAAQVALEKGHILVYPPAEETDLEPLLTGSDDDKLRTLLEAGCALIACHPYDKSTDYSLGDLVVQFTALHAAQIVNAGSVQAANDLALEVVENLDIAAAGGTGSDGPLGKAATLFSSNVATQAELVEEIKRGDCWAVSLGSEDRWTSVERRPEKPRGRGDRGGRGRGGRDGDRRGGRNRGDRDRGGRGRGRDRGEGDSGRSRGDRSGGGNRGNRSGGSNRGDRSRARKSGEGNRPPRGDSRGNRPDQLEKPDEINGNLIPDDSLPPEIDGNR